MAGIGEQLAESLKEVFGVQPRAIQSAAPGVGPEAARESDRVALGGRIGSWVPRGGDAAGYGGHGDAVILDDTVSDDVARLVAEHVRRAQRRALHQPKPSNRIRLAKGFSLDAHTEDWDGNICGPVSLFNGTIGAPSAGVSQQIVPITVAAGQPSPVLLMFRYPGTMYVSLFVTTFSFVPTGTTTTGIQEAWFSDPTGATVPLGVYVAGNQTVGAKQTIGALCSGPITDPGNTTLGNLVINNIGIAGTPTTVRYQLGISYVGFYADPWFNEQVVIPPTPAEIAEGLESIEAQG